MPKFEVSVDCGGGVVHTDTILVKQSIWDAMDEWEREECLAEACADLVLDKVKTSWREL